MVKRITFATLSAAVVIWGIADAIINPRKMRSTLPAVAVGPVGATREGQLIYGACIGFITYIIRHWGGYPDAVAFAVLLMNMAAPTIDYYTQPRVFGQRSTGDD